MSYDTRERSLATGQPVRLYDFRRGAQRWSYCSADRAINFQAATWRAVAISDDGVRLTGEASADVLLITAPATLEVAQLFRAAPPSAEIEVTVRDYHYGEADTAASAVVVWAGSISGVGWPQADRCAISCESLGASMERPGLHMSWERTCPHTVYGPRCGVDRNLFAVEAEVQTLTGAAISSGAMAAHPDGYFSGGYVEWPVGAGELERRGVELHSGSELLLLGGTQGLVAGQPFTAYPGCRQTDSYCNTIFFNLPRFGGFKHLPGKSPFDGDPIF